MNDNYLVLITGDMNDGDYKTVKHEVDKDTVEIIRKVAKVVLKNNKYDYNWPAYDLRKEYGNPYEMYKDELTQEEMDIFSGFVPSGGDYPIHSIESIEIYQFTTKEEIK